MVHFGANRFRLNDQPDDARAENSGRLFDLGDLGAANRDLPGFLRLGNLAGEINMQQAIGKIGSRHLDVVGELEAPLEGARRNALIENLRLFGGALAIARP